jgi:hypothetical protein
MEATPLTLVRIGSALDCTLASILAKIEKEN